MMSLVIQKRRKELGLTQEQVAEYLGVTTPAVNKWERGNTCPDISLLPPLARLLKIDLNTLFGFEEEITQQELICFCKEIREQTQNIGFEAGLETAKEKIRAYPNSEKLLYHAALQLQSCLALSGLGSEMAAEHLNTIMQWYERLINSEESAIRNSACYMLAGHAIGEGQYDRAQRYLDQMPNRMDMADKRMLQARLYLKQSRAEEAAKLMETALLTGVNELQTVLFVLIDAEMALGDRGAAEYAAQRVTKLAETFDLNEYNTAVAPFQIAAANQDVENTVAALKKMLDALSAPRDIQSSPLYRRIEVTSNAEAMKNMISPLLSVLQESPEYEFLRSNREFQELLAVCQEQAGT